VCRCDCKWQPCLERKCRPGNELRLRHASNERMTWWRVKSIQSISHDNKGQPRGGTASIGAFDLLQPIATSSQSTTAGCSRQESLRDDGGVESDCALLDRVRDALHVGSFRQPGDISGDPQPSISLHVDWRGEAHLRPWQDWASQVSFWDSSMVSPPIGGSGRLLGPRPGLESLPVGDTPAGSGGISSRRQTLSSMLVHLPLWPAWLCLRCCLK